VTTSLIAFEVAGLDWRLALLCVVTITAGAAVQATIGFGMAVLAAPLLGLIDPGFLPVATLLMGLPLSIGVARRELQYVAWDDVATATLGRLPGVVLGSWVVATTGATAIRLIVGLSVLTAIVVSVTGFKVSTTRRSLIIAGLASGFSGTAAGVGGPPMAVAYQHSHPATTRATLGVFFGIGTVISFLGLLAAGEVHLRQIQLSALLLPGVLLGLALSGPLVSRLPPERVRAALLGLSLVSASALLIETIIEMFT
jgi:uncharacterized membrane protein YfcA